MSERKPTNSLRAAILARMESRNEPYWEARRQVVYARTGHGAPRPCDTNAAYVGRFRPDEDEPLSAAEAERRRTHRFQSRIAAALQVPLWCLGLGKQCTVEPPPPEEGL